MNFTRYSISTLGMLQKGYHPMVSALWYDNGSKANLVLCLGSWNVFYVKQDHVVFWCKSGWYYEPPCTTPWIN